MSEVEFKKFAICDTCGVETLCRVDGEDDQCGACYWAPINHAKHQAELAALREELADVKAGRDITLADLNRADDIRSELQQRLADAERRNAEQTEGARELLQMLTSLQRAHYEQHSAHHSRLLGAVALVCRTRDYIAEDPSCAWKLLNELAAAVHPTDEEAAFPAALNPNRMHVESCKPDHSGGAGGKVVLPERREPKHYWDRFGKMTAIARVSSEEWNACLDKVKELNQ